MMRNALKICAGLCMPLLTACHHEDAPSNAAATGTAHVTCYAGKDSIYDGDTAPGRLPVAEGSGIRFADAKTGRQIHVYGGTCLVVEQN